MTNSLAYCTYAICTALSVSYGSHDIAFSLLMMLVIWDTIAGTIKHFALWKWLSRGMAIGVFVKSILYLWWPMMVHTFVTTYLWYDVANVDNIMAGVLTIFAIAEWISIIQNLIVAQTKDESYSETDTITMLLWIAKRGLSFIFSFMIKKLEDNVKKLEDEKLKEDKKSI